MEKAQIVKLLKDKRRGIYPTIISQYSEIINETSVAIAVSLIQEDLQKSTGEEVELNYFSLAQAIAKTKSKKVKVEFESQDKKKWEFKDAHELPSKIASEPGKFKMEE